MKVMRAAASSLGRGLHSGRRRKNDFALKYRMGQIRFTRGRRNFARRRVLRAQVDDDASRQNLGAEMPDVLLVAAVGLLPLFLTEAGLPFHKLGIIAATYPGVWGTTQLLTGALSDRWGRKWLIAWGMWVQGIAIAMLVIFQGFWPWMGSSVLLGVGTALVYPTLLAAVSDLSEPAWRASAVGVYRLWRDSGYAVGGLTAGLIADSLGVPCAIIAVAGLTFLSGILVAKVMAETHGPGSCEAESLRSP